MLSTSTYNQIPQIVLFSEKKKNSRKSNNQNFNTTHEHAGWRMECVNKSGTVFISLTETEQWRPHPTKRMSDVHLPLPPWCTGHVQHPRWMPLCQCTNISHPYREFAQLKEIRLSAWDDQSLFESICWSSWLRMPSPPGCHLNQRLNGVANPLLLQPLFSFCSVPGGSCTSHTRSAPDKYLWGVVKEEGHRMGWHPG